MTGRRVLGPGPCRALVAVGLCALALLLVTTGGALTGGAAWAFWSVATSGPGEASAATVPQGARPTATANGSQVTLAWAPRSLSDGAAVTGYTVIRYDTQGNAVSPGTGCASPVASTGCTENAVPNGTWRYTVTPRFAAWSGAPSGPSDPVTVNTDTTPPVNDISRVALSGGSSKSGDTIYYRGAAAGSFRLSNALSDPGGSGPAASNTGGLGGTTTGWTHSPSSVNTPTGGPFVSNIFSWTAGTTSSPTLGVVGLDNAGNTAATTLSFVLDNTRPTGGAISYPSGLRTESTIAVSLASIGDAGSGVGEGTRYLQRGTSALTTNEAGTSGTCATIVWDNTYLQDPPANRDETIAPGRCYQFRYAFTDNVGNTTTTTGALGGIAKPSYTTVVRATNGLLSYWRLDDTGPSITDLGPASNTGAYTNGPSLGQGGAVPGGNTAATFNGTNQYGRVTRQISDDFTIELWFKSTQGIGTGTQWWQGAGLVDAEVAGATNDFGVSLRADGRIMAGVGNPDRTAMSATGYNDGAWHHVVMTRTRSTGVVQLYLDGSPVAGTTGNTNALTAPTNIDFARIQTGGNYFAGSLDEIALYTRALSASEVAQHYEATQP